MARPKTKNELLELSQKNFKRLIQLVNSFSEEEQNTKFPEGTLNRNINDVLAHIHHWHLMMLDWYTVGMTGKKPNMPAKGYTWKTVPDLNNEIWKKYHDIRLEKTQEMLNVSFHKLQTILVSHSDIELFEKKRYKWTGTTSLGSYLISATSSHYDWAFKFIKKSKK